MHVTTNMFALTNTVRVLNIQRHPASTLEALSAGDPNTDKWQCPHTFILPFEPVPLVLEKVLSPQEATFVIQPWSSFQGQDTGAKPLVGALWIART